MSPFSCSVPCKGLKRLADRAVKLLIDRIGNEDGQLYPGLAKGLQSFTAACGRTDQAHGVHHLVRNRCCRSCLISLSDRLVETFGFLDKPAVTEQAIVERKSPGESQVRAGCCSRRFYIIRDIDRDPQGDLDLCRVPSSLRRSASHTIYSRPHPVRCAQVEHRTVSRLACQLHSFQGQRTKVNRNPVRGRSELNPHSFPRRPA